jgi:putative transposase
LGGRRGRLISASDRSEAIKLIAEAKESGASEKKACEEIGISLRTLQRWREEGAPKEDQRPQAKRPAPVNKLSDDEVKRGLDIANQPEFGSLPPSQIVPILSDMGEYIMSESSFYRYFKKNGMQHHRGRSKKPNPKPVSTHSATKPNEVWMWDITWLPGPIKGTHFYLYLVLDLYSRKIVGWEIWPEESAENASTLIKKAVLSENCFTSINPLVLHSDNGSPMKGSTMLETLYTLGIILSRSRPRVSNNNPFAESVFRTCKYRPTYPMDGFIDITEARQWVKEFVSWYNYEHRHSGLNFITPDQRHRRLDKQIFSNRRKVYEEAKARHPERWSKGTRDWSLDDEVWLNPERKASKPGKQEQKQAS